MNFQDEKNIKSDKILLINFIQPQCTINHLIKVPAVEREARVKKYNKNLIFSHPKESKANIVIQHPRCTIIKNCTIFSARFSLNMSVEL